MAGLFFFFFTNCSSPLTASFQNVIVAETKYELIQKKKKIQVNFNPPLYNWHMFLITIALKHEIFYTKIIEILVPRRLGGSLIILRAL